MDQQFREWLVQRGNPGAATYYPSAIHRISDHYSNQTGTTTNIYSVTNQRLISEIAHDYSQAGRFAQFGNENHGRCRAAIARYSEFFVQRVGAEARTEDAEDVDIQIERSFTYERDLQTSLCAQISELFPDCRIFGGDALGIEYAIGGKRIDVLLERNDGAGLLAVELKSGVADYKTFGQISMYMGLLKEQFPGREINGLIVAGSIDSSLTQACATTDRVTLKVYRMSIELDDA